MSCRGRRAGAGVGATRCGTGGAGAAVFACAEGERSAPCANAGFDPGAGFALAPNARFGRDVKPGFERSEVPADGGAPEVARLRVEGSVCTGFVRCDAGGVDAARPSSVGAARRAPAFGGLPRRAFAWTDVGAVRAVASVVGAGAGAGDGTAEGAAEGDFGATLP